MTNHFDTVVLGAGPGGYVGAIRAAQLGQKVAIIEPRYWGGVCLNVGCIPSKALLRNAQIAYTYQHDAQLFGIKGEVSFDFGAAFDRSRKVSENIVKGVHFLMRKNKITEIHGKGSFKDSHTIRVALNDGGQEEVTSDNIIINVGSTVKTLPGIELSQNVVTFEQQILSRNLPKSIIIIGAGAIGIEFAYVLVNYGVEVTIVEYFDRILPLEDAEVSQELRKQYTKLGVKIITSAKVQKVTDHDNTVTVSYADANDTSHEITAERVLLSVGFAPRIDGYGLENTGVELTPLKAIKIDDYMRTSVSGIYAVGDVTAKLQLAHVAEAQAVVAAETIAGVPTLPIDDYRFMPRATFCNPQVASFGLTEEQAQKEGYDVNVAKFPFSANGKAQGLGEAVGFVKVIADKKYGELLGAHMIGPDVSELLPELTLAQKWDLTVNELVRNVHTHPTLSEAVQEAVHGLAGHMINL